MTQNQDNFEPNIFDFTSTQTPGDFHVCPNDESTEIPILPIDFGTNDATFDTNIFHDQASEGCRLWNIDSYNTPAPEPLDYGENPAISNFSASSSTEGLLSDIFNSPLLATNSPEIESEAQIDTTSGVEVTSMPLTGDVNLQKTPLQTPNNQFGLPRWRSRYFVSNSEVKNTPSRNVTTSELDPMQRWQTFRPEEEPTSVAAIMNAMQETPTPYRTDQQYRGRGKTSSRSRRSYSNTSRESSVSSADSAWSSGARSSRTRNRRSKAHVTKSQSNNGKARIFCCTFCCDRFGTKYEWVRHEKSLHLNLETWYCAPLGPSVFSSITGKMLCAFCDVLEPSQEHLLMHNYDACKDLSNELRSFHRKDHLVQHLRHVHQVHNIPPLDDWKKEMKSFTSRCGFCDVILDNWDDRVSHLARHFRNGSTMKDWKGDHDFAPHITAQLQNAYPPYLLGWESECIVPFSATSKDVRDQYSLLMSGTNMTNEDSGYPECLKPEFSLTHDDQTMPQLPGFLDVFTRHLSQYGRKQMELGIIPTDEMFQKEARKVLFHTEDAWDQTIADNADWLSAFRRLHLNSIVSGSSLAAH
ncbi:hypothetical protein N7509_009478 [Penicillium cosmopolitanum]|uniref:C2H2-type domain-containing protein n=1 Tax=Penicillium cosmopolitanum TaxID=1131564 RepID=A0A9W9VPJ8_9EURO|nr:uncharacterized protein N7509_009478 [Penicillium cosmopolitanum]KAJ5386937.1 hypothetical protein N7509_009478 [Penicillium cosmopolitanum]